MKIRLLSLLTAVLATVGVARAEEFQFTSHQQMGAAIQRQDQEIGELRAQLASLQAEHETYAAGGCADGSCNQGGYGDCSQGGCGSCGGSGCDSCCNSCCNSCDDGCSCCPEIGEAHTQCGFYGYGEAVVVRPFLAEGFGAGGVIGGLPIGAQGEFSLAVTPRATVGWVGDCGFGFRGRYWQYHQFGGNPANVNVFNYAINLHVTDLEFTDRICLGQWLLTGFAGARYVRNVQTLSAQGAGAAPFVLRDNFQGVGLTTGLDALRPVSSNWSLYGNARVSVLVGTQNYQTTVGGVPVLFGAGGLGGRHAIREIMEIGMGIQYNRQLSNGLGLFGRAGVEAQYWGSGATNFAANFGGIPNVPRQDSGFAGFTAGAGVVY